MQNTTKTILVVLGLLIVGGLGYVALRPAAAPEEPTHTAPTFTDVLDPKNASYVIEHVRFTLVDGEATEGTLVDPRFIKAFDSSAQYRMQCCGNEVRADMNNDGIDDAAFLLWYATGGTGSFTVLAALASDGDHYTATNTLFIGDRIAPQTTEYRDGMIIVNYADRGPDQAMVEAPSVGVSKYFRLDGTTLVEVAR